MFGHSATLHTHRHIHHALRARILKLIQSIPIAVASSIHSSPLESLECSVVRPTHEAQFITRQVLRHGGDGWRAQKDEPEASERGRTEGREEGVDLTVMSECAL